MTVLVAVVPHDASVTEATTPTSPTRFTLEDDIPAGMSAFLVHPVRADGRGLLAIQGRQKRGRSSSQLLDGVIESGLRRFESLVSGISECAE